MYILFYNFVAKHVMEVIEEQHTRLEVDRRSIKILKSALNVTGANIKRLARHLDYAENLIQANTVWQPFQEEVYRLISGFELLFHYKLSPKLVHATALKAKLLILKDRLAKKGYTMGISTLQEAFQLPTSHIVFKNGTIDIILHVPAYRTHSVLDLYEYMPAPFIFPTKTANGDSKEIILMPQTEKTYLALNYNKSIIRTFTKLEMSQCKTIGHHHFCQQENFYDRTLESDCLFSLFKATIKDVHRNCDFKLGPKRDFLHQITPHSFLLYQYSNEVVTRHCPVDSGYSDMTQAVFKGLKILTVPPTCWVESRSFYFEGDYDVFIDKFDLQFQPLNISKMLTIEEQAILTHAYSTVAKETEAILVPVGLAWKQTRNEEGEGH